MIKPIGNERNRRAHTLMELVVAMVASGMLLAGLGSVMFIGRQVAYIPSAAGQRIEAADIVSKITDDLQNATLLIGTGPRILEFVVADRDADNRAERIRYEWRDPEGGPPQPGDPVYKTLNGGDPTIAAPSVQQFLIEYIVDDEMTTVETSTDTAETALLNLPVQSGQDRENMATRSVAQQIDPAAFISATRPAGAIGWTATKIKFYASKASSDTETLLVQLRAGGDSYNGATSHVLGEVQLPESSLSGGIALNTAGFANPVRGLTLDRQYAVTWATLEASGEAAKMRVTFDQTAPIGVFESTDAGASWHHWQENGLYGQLYGELHGTYIVPGPTYNITRKFVPRVRVTLQADEPAHSRVESAVPLANRPEVLSAYWRTDFTGDPLNDVAAAIDPTAADHNGDRNDDWDLAAGGTFDVNALSSGIWTVSGRLETRPANDFTGVTIVEARCRGGATLRINADRQDSLRSPLTVRVQPQGSNAQRLTLDGESSAGASKPLCSVSDLAGDVNDDNSLIQFRLVILPAHNLVNLCVNGEDQGTFAYPPDGPPSADGFVSLFGDGAQFDYVEVRVSDDAVVEQL